MEQSTNSEPHQDVGAARPFSEQGAPPEREAARKDDLPMELAGTRLPRYRRLRRTVIAATTAVSLIPLFILTAISFYQDRQAYFAENNFAVSQILSNTKRTLEFVIEERRAATALMIRSKPYDELASNDELARALQDLNYSFGGFVDLGVINSDGLQAYYAGPYNLQDLSYQDQSWFHEVVLRGSHVSDVFMGHREFPHFVVAIKHEREPGDFFIIRATIDMELINREMNSLSRDRSADVFIVNHDGVLQTESVFYGNALTTADIEVPAGPRHREMVERVESDGNHAIKGFAYIEGAPFILMVEKKLEGPIVHWLSHRSDVLWFLLLSATLILVVVWYGATNMAKHLREADLRRVRAFHNIEYTNKMATIGRMAASVAHEINNPMAIINEKAGLMKDLIAYSEEFPQKDKLLGLVDSIEQSVDRCSRVTHRLLGFSRRMEVRTETIDVSSLLKEVVSFQDTEVRHKNIAVRYDFQDDLPAVESDRGQLQQVFLNLFNNAVAAVSSGGSIDISAARHGDNVVVAVTDNGKGIPPENLRHIFEPFFSTKGEFGTGLGLSITRDIVEKIGGKIDAESELGKVTRFLITLPIKRRGVGA
ncbi:two-component sensor histidine kinase [candidate division GN15 bacterium]|nr:two-component sensor histidine kinase [candidate division GN15 bacterium]